MSTSKEDLSAYSESCYELATYIVKLTKREHEVFRAVALTMSFTEAARIVGCTPGTVEQHVYKAMRKLELHTLGAMYLYAVRLKVIPLPSYEEIRKIRGRI